MQFLHSVSTALFADPWLPASFAFRSCLVVLGFHVPEDNLTQWLSTWLGHPHGCNLTSLSAAESLLLLIVESFYLSETRKMSFSWSVVAIFEVFGLYMGIGRRNMNSELCRIWEPTLPSLSYLTFLSLLFDGSMHAPTLESSSSQACSSSLHGCSTLQPKCTSYVPSSSASLLPHPRPLHPHFKQRVLVRPGAAHRSTHSCWSGGGCPLRQVLSSFAFSPFLSYLFVCILLCIVFQCLQVRKAKQEGLVRGSSGLFSSQPIGYTLHV